MRSLLGAIEYVDSRDILQIKVKRLPQYFVLTSQVKCSFDFDLPWWMEEKEKVTTCWMMISLC